MDGRSPRVHTSLPAWGAFALVLVLGVLDGGLRAHFQLPTILGETISYSADAAVGTAARSHGFAHERGAGRRLLFQQTLGGTCTHAWNCDEGLVCRDGFCETCETNAECFVRNDKEQCFNSTVSGAPVCKHKPLFGPFDHSDMWIAAITFVTIVLAAPSGIGGGGILVPMYLAIGKFSPRHGIPLSKATIFGGAVTNNYFNVQKRHPDVNRPMIDYNICMVMEPVLLLGTIIGVFFNAVSPGWLITICLVFTLTYTTYRTTLKAMETYEKEMKIEREEEEQRLLPAGGPDKKQHISFTPERAPDGLQHIYEEESRVNWRSIGVLCISWIIIAIFSILKGGEGGQGIVECGTLGYWALVVAPVPLVGALVWKMGDELADRHEEKVARGFEFADGDLMWTRRNARIYPLYTITAGFAAGALGIAAGTILGPILLEMGLLPLVGTASSGFMVIFTSSSTTFQFLVMGQLQVDYALFFCLIGFVGGAIGNTAVGYLVKKYKKTWFVVALLSAVLALSTFLMGYAGYERAMVGLAHGKNQGIRPLCPIRLNPNLLAKAVAKAPDTNHLAQVECPRHPVPP